MLRRIAIIALSTVTLGASTPATPANTGAYDGAEEAVVITVQKDDDHVGPERPEEVIDLGEELDLF